MKLLKNTLTGIAVLITITIIAMATAPTLSNDNVNPPTGDTTQTFDFSVTFTDADNDTATYVNVTINGTEYTLSETDPGDVDTTDGKDYSKTNLAFITSGTYNYSFTAADANGTAAPLNGSFTVTEATVAPTVIDYTPKSNPSTPNGTAQDFGVMFDQDVNVVWKINDTVVQTNSSVAPHTTVYYVNSTAPVGTHTVTANGSNANGSAVASWTWTVTDSTPPAQITSLTSTAGMTWINWTWVNPADGDFNHVEVYLDGAFRMNIIAPQNYYDTSLDGLTLEPNRNYNISTRTVDNDGNVNTSWVNGSATTLPNTPTGDVSLQFGDAFVNFTGVTSAGNTTMVVNTTRPANHDFSAASNYYYIETTSVFTSADISIPYNYPGDESLVRLYHWDGANWIDVTTTVDSSNDMVYGSVASLSPFVAGVPQSPGITAYTPTDLTPENLDGETRTFNITVNQTVNIKWEINGAVNASLTNLTVVNLTKGAGNYNVTVTAFNANGSSNVEWNWTVHPKFYDTGNRIWDEAQDMNTVYTWTPQSFSGFFYDLDEDVSSENLTITLDSKTDRTVDEGDLVYTSVPVPVSYKYNSWGTYKAIGFLAKKYFAEYIDNGVVPNKNLLSSGYLSEILIDEGESNEKHTITVGSTLPLKEGYALKAIDVSVQDAFVRFILLKDGEEISGSDDIVGNGENYVYEKKIGSVKDVPIIIVHVENVFHGRETDAAFIRGVFQISDNPAEVRTGDTYGVMEVKSKSGGITMKNDHSIDLSRDSTVDIMGDIKFKVADSDTLRFAPFVAGIEELRGTVSRGDATFEWTPLNFEGLYYDFDTGFSSETLNATLSGRDIPEGSLVYKAVPINTAFEYDAWGKYDLVGFMAEKYFAAYSNTNVDDADDNILSSGYLSKVLIDEGSSHEKHTITIGSTLPLKEGYALKAIDISVEDTLVRFILLKDGEEVSGSDDIVNNNDDYVYSRKVGSVNDVPIIMVHVENVFHGRETDAAFIRGVFQISENPVQIKTGDDYGIMEVKSKSGGITMKNSQTISLDPDSTVDVMGEIRFKVADNSTDLRYYPFITVDLEAESASKLSISAPSTATERDTITITVTAGGEIVEGADVEFDGENIGTTDSNGEIIHTLTKMGSFTIGATKVGYESASKTITVEKYVDMQLKIDSTSELLQVDNFEMTVTVGGEPLSGVNILVDDAIVGTTDDDGYFSYLFETSGAHTVKVEKDGYITSEKTINVIKPYSEFKATAFNVTPVNVTLKEPVFITANITNTGNIKGNGTVELKINGTVVDSQNITLEPGEVVTVNFSYVELVKGTYFAEILNMGGEFHAVKKSIGWMVYAGIATVIGIILIYLITMRPEAIAPVSAKAVVMKDQLALKLSQLKMRIKK